MSKIFPAHETMLSKVILVDPDCVGKEGSIAGSSGENEEAKREMEKGYGADVTVGMAKV